MAWHELCDEADLPMGQKKAFKIAGQQVILYHLDDGFYASQARCTHLFKSMANGKLLEGGKIECPLHKACFDVRSGQVERWANFPPGVQLLNALRAEKALQTYPVKLDAGKVMIDV